MRGSRIIVAKVLLGVVAMLCFATPVSAADSQGSEIDVNAHNPDLCKNIAGNQNTVPPGMILDGNGNCLTPEVPPPPPPLDVCLNFPGLQVSVPSGYYLDAYSGNCIRIVEPEPEPEPEPTPEEEEETKELLRLAKLDWERQVR